MTRGVRNNILKRSRPLLFGVGINDADYFVDTKVDGKRTYCKIYQCWANMLRGGYCNKCKALRPTYSEATVEEDWHSFMNFRAWMIEQDWEGKHLDKDILLQGNKVYGPNTCIFIDRQMDSILLDAGRNRGNSPIGVSWCSTMSKWSSNIRNNGKLIYMGCFETQMLAHRAWQLAKIKYIKSFIKPDTDERVKVALLLRCDQLQYDINNGLETTKL